MLYSKISKCQRDVTQMSFFGGSKRKPNLGNVAEGRPELRLIKSEWTPVGKLVDFPLHKPKVMMMHKRGLTTRRTQPLYVIQRYSKKFVVLDLNTLGEYEYRVSGEQVYVRRLFPATV